MSLLGPTELEDHFMDSQVLTLYLLMNQGRSEAPVATFTGKCRGEQDRSISCALAADNRDARESSSGTFRIDPGEPGLGLSS